MKEAKSQQMPEGRADAGLWTRQPGRQAAGLWPRPGQRGSGWHRAPASCPGSAFPSVGPPARCPPGGEGAGAVAHECQARCACPAESCRPRVYGTFFFFFLSFYDIWINVCADDLRCPVLITPRWYLHLSIQPVSHVRELYVLRLF